MNDIISLFETLYLWTAAYVSSLSIRFSDFPIIYSMPYSSRTSFIQNQFIIDFLQQLNYTIV
jgi:hypothetical protein